MARRLQGWIARRYRSHPNEVAALIEQAAQHAAERP
jgi:hypothetical protein